ncbi:MAG: hypothetical protein ABIT71_14265 [Vicinamibacteraceae bacterium]
MADADPLIRRLQRDAVIWCGLATAAALALRPGTPAIAAGVAGGGLLALVSLFAIRSSVDVLVGRVVSASIAAPGAAPGADPDGLSDVTGPAASPARAAAGVGVKLAGRYLVLGLAAYVMIARLRLHPVGLLIGASSLVAGASIEAVRSLRRP